MHVGYHIEVEWGIGGVIQEWRRLMKRFDNRLPRFNHFFDVAAKLTNFLHHCRMNFDKVLSKDQEENNENYGWGGDF